MYPQYVVPTKVLLWKVAPAQEGLHLGTPEAPSLVEVVVSVAPSLVVVEFPLVVLVVVPAFVAVVEVSSPSLAVPVATALNSVEFVEVPVRRGLSRMAPVKTHASWLEYLQ